jgi:hypothetical protein
MQELRLARVSDIRLGKRGKAKRRRTPSRAKTRLRGKAKRVKRRSTARQSRKRATVEFDPRKGVNMTAIAKLAKTRDVTLKLSKKYHRDVAKQRGRRAKKGRRVLSMSPQEYEHFYRLQSVLPILGELKKASAGKKRRGRRR